MTIPRPLSIGLRKVGSAVRLYRRHGAALVFGMARAQAGAFLSANAILPSGPQRRAELLSERFNDGALFSSVPIDRQDVALCRKAILFPYLRGRFFDAAAAAARCPDLTPVERMILGDSWFRLFEFRRLDDHLARWRPQLAPTKFTRRFGQLVRRVDLRLGRLGAAAAGLEAAAGGDAAEWLLRGDIFDAAGRLEEASAAYRQAAHRQAYRRDVLLNTAFHLLKRGRIRDGFATWAAADGVIGEYPLRRRRPQWTGGRLGPEHRLMVVFEHGFGDMIQFSRFLQPLRRAVPEAQILGRVPAALLGLMARSFPDVGFVSQDDPEPDYDYFVPSVQLCPLLEAQDLEPRAGYLDLGPPALPPHGPAAPKRIGLCWRGQPRHYDLTRSIPLADFARLFAVPGLSFVVLQHQPSETEVQLLQAHAEVLVPPIADFAALGRLVAACDLVVSVDTAVAHVAAAGGRPLLLLSRPDACWRWAAAGPRSPWYATAEVLRHPGDLDWAAVLDQAAARLAGLVADSAGAAAAAML